MPNHFKVLGLTPIANGVEIHNAYKRLSLIHHPDMEGGDNEKFLAIKESFKALETESDRNTYLKFIRFTMKECPVCNGQGVVWKQQGFTHRAGLTCNACDGAGYE